MGQTIRMVVIGFVLGLAVGCESPPAPPVAPANSTVPESPAEPDPAEKGAAYVPEKLNVPQLPNAYRLTEKVISGGLPEGDAAFQELQDLGVKTIISVDGATPDVELAKKYGLQYVHLPHGYDGVPAERVPQLAKAVRDLPGPIYIHCHHGKHRSPAAAAVACVGAGMLPASQALAVLKTAGTNPNYRGLYQSAERARAIDAKLLDVLEVDYPERMKIPPLAEAMVQVEHLHDHLKKLSQNQWQTLPDHPDLSAAHEALLLREQYTELLRTDAVKEQPEGFRVMLQASEKTAEELERVFLSATPEMPLDEVRASELFKMATEQCSSCHKAYRDVPLGEKSK